MVEAIVIKVPEGSEPVEIRRGWLLLRFILLKADMDGGPTRDSITGEPMPIRGREFTVEESEAFRIMDAQRPGMADYYRANQHPSLCGLDFSFVEDELHFLGTEDNSAWG